MEFNHLIDCFFPSIPVVRRASLPRGGLSIGPQLYGPVPDRVRSKEESSAVAGGRVLIAGL